MGELQPFIMPTKGPDRHQPISGGFIHPSNPSSSSTEDSVSRDMEGQYVTAPAPIPCTENGHHDDLQRLPRRKDTNPSQRSHSSSPVRRPISPGGRAMTQETEALREIRLLRKECDAKFESLYRFTCQLLEGKGHAERLQADEREEKNNLSRDRIPRNDTAIRRDLMAGDPDETEVKRRADSNTSDSCNANQAEPVAQRNIHEPVGITQGKLNKSMQTPFQKHDCPLDAAVTAVFASVNECIAKLDEVSKRMDRCSAQFNAQIAGMGEAKQRAKTSCNRVDYNPSRIASDVAEAIRASVGRLMPELRDAIEASMRGNVDMQFMWRDEEMKANHSQIMRELDAREKWESHFSEGQDHIEVTLQQLLQASQVKAQEETDVLTQISRALANSEQSMLKLERRMDEHLLAFQSQGSTTSATIVDNIKTNLEDAVLQMGRDNENIRGRLDELENKQDDVTRRLAKNAKSLEQRLDLTASILEKQWRHQENNAKVLKGGLGAVASRLKATKHDIFVALDKEAQQLRDSILDTVPTHDPGLPTKALVKDFDFYIDAFVARFDAAIALAQQAGAREDIVGGVGGEGVGQGEASGYLAVDMMFAEEDTKLRSFMWYVQHPVDTSVQGLVEFSPDGKLKVFLVPARSPYEVGLTPRYDTMIRCQVAVIDRTGGDGDIMVKSGRTDKGGAMVDPLKWFSLSESAFKGQANGGYIGEVSCQEILDHQLVAKDETVLLRFKVAFAAQHNGGRP